MRAQKKNRRPVTLETLENRTLMSASMDYDGVSTLTVKATTGSNQITIWCQDLETSHGTSVRQWIVGVNDQFKTFDTDFIYSVNVYGKGGNDNIDIEGLPSASNTYVYTGAGTSSLQLEEMSGGAHLTYHGGGQDTINYDAPFFQPVNDFALTHNAIQWNKINDDRVKFDGVQNLNFSGGVHPDRINVLSVPYNMNVNVNGAEQNDTITVGNGNIAGDIRGNLHISGGTNFKGIDTLVFNDTQNPYGGIYTLDYNSFKMFGLPNPINWDGIDNVTLNASNQDDYINVNTAGEKMLKINGDGGNDNINLGSSGPGGTLDFVQTVHIAIDGGAGIDHVLANDQFTGGPQSYLIGSNKFICGADPAWGTANIEYFTLFTASGNSFVDASGAGESIIVHGSGGNDTVYGGAFNDSLYGGAGNDYIYGNGGDDIIDGGTGSDYMSGGQGWDEITYASRVKGVSVNLNKLTGNGEAGENDSIFNDFEEIQGGQGNDYIVLNLNTAGFVYGNGGNDTLIGGNKSDGLIGGDGNDLLKGGGSLDLLVGGAGNDKISSGAGNDFIYANDGDKDTLDAGTGNDTIYKDANDVFQTIP